MAVPCAHPLASTVDLDFVWYFSNRAAPLVSMRFPLPYVVRVVMTVFCPVSVCYVACTICLRLGLCSFLLFFLLGFLFLFCARGAGGGADSRMDGHYINRRSLNRVG